MFAYELNTLPFEQQGILPWMKNWVAFSPDDEKVRVKVTKNLRQLNYYLGMKKWEWKWKEKLKNIELLFVEKVRVKITRKA